MSREQGTGNREQNEAAGASSSPDPSSLRLFAVELARLGGRTASRLFGKVTVRRKADNSPVTEADHITQDAILRAIAERFPDHAVLVEETLANPERHAPLRELPDQSPDCEGGVTPPRTGMANREERIAKVERAAVPSIPQSLNPSVPVSDYCWIIDPIDGTRNFARGVRVFATSVAVLHRGVPVAGAVYDATSEVVYSAAAGQGAFRDEEKLELPAADSGDSERETTIAVGSFRRKPMPPFVGKWMSRYVTRNLGSTSLHFTWVAAGLVDAAYSNEAKLWDIAAAALLIEEAGGSFLGESVGPIWPFDVSGYAGGDLHVLGGSKSILRELRGDLSA